VFSANGLIWWIAISERDANLRGFAAIIFSADGAASILAWGNAPGFGNRNGRALKARFNPCMQFYAEIHFEAALSALFLFCRYGS